MLINLLLILSLVVLWSRNFIEGFNGNGGLIERLRNYLRESKERQSEEVKEIANKQRRLKQLQQEIRDAEIKPFLDARARARIVGDQFEKTNQFFQPRPLRFHRLSTLQPF